MRLISFYISLPFFTSAFLMMYQVVVILLLIGTLFRNKIKSESYNLLYVFNTLAAWSSLVVVLAYAAEFFIAWYGQNPYEWDAFSEQVNQDFWIWFFVINLLSFLLGFLFFFRKMRTKRWFILLFYLSNFGFFYERIVIFITGLYRDYLPSSWSSYSADMYPKYVYSFGLIILLLAFIYIWAKKKRRLPFPSVLLK